VKNQPAICLMVLKSKTHYALAKFLLFGLGILARVGESTAKDLAKYFGYKPRCDYPLNA
jgi:NAD-dependent DNA ligase